MTVVPKTVYYYVGEKPPALPCRYEDKNGVLDASISGATLTAKCRVGENVEFDVGCTNNDDGTFTIDWATGASASSFAHAGAMRIDIQVADGTRTWFMPRFSIPVRDRTLV